MFTVKNIFDEMDKIAPLSFLQSGDNSGLIVGEMCDKASKILLALDISLDIVEEADEIGADVIISHHPVIYEPLFRLTANHPACLALMKKIALICWHSPLDIAPDGINGVIYEMLKIPFKLSDKKTVLEPIFQDGFGYGMVCGSCAEITVKEAAGILKKLFGCPAVRYTEGKKTISKLAFCSGSGGSNISLALKKGADTYITGDIKHSQWIEAKNAGMSLFDCGHYFTEALILKHLKYRLEKALTGVDISVAESDRCPFTEL